MSCRQGVPRKWVAEDFLRSPARWPWHLCVCQSRTRRSVSLSSGKLTDRGQSERTPMISHDAGSPFLGDPLFQALELSLQSICQALANLAILGACGLEQKSLQENIISGEMVEQ